MHIIAKYTQTAIRIVEYSVGNAEGGHSGVYMGCKWGEWGPSSKVAKECPVMPGVRSHCPQCPIAAEAVEDGVHIIEGHLHRNWNH